MPDKKFRVGVDCDDTLFDFIGRLKEYKEYTAKLNEMPFINLPDPKSWSFEQQWGLSRQGLNDLMLSFARAGGFRELLPIPGAFTVIKNLRAAGHQIAIVTARESWMDNRLLRAQVQADTIHSLVSCGFEYDELHFLPEKKNVSVDILLDDAVHHLEAAQLSGLKAVCMTRLHNVEWAGYRVKDWFEFETLINNWSAE